LGLSKDFTGLSELLLGQAQPAQFQSSDQTGYWWGSKVSDDGNFTPLDSFSLNNANVEIPRTYNRGVEYFYNALSASAESDIDTSNSYKSFYDSICPHSWKLPEYNGEDGHYVTLLTNYSDVVHLTTLPVNFVYGGYYWYNGEFQDKDAFYYSTSRTASNRAIYNFTYNSSGAGVARHTGTTWAAGYQVRCVVDNGQ